MTDLEIGAPTLDTIRRHGAETYPEECCGFLVGSVNVGAGSRRVVAARRAANEVESNRRRRFVIEPESLAHLEEELEPSGLTVVGFYHSHPDHPAEPSEFDTEHAWPWYTYVVMSVNEGRPGDFRAFELDSDRREFRPVRITFLPLEESRDEASLTTQAAI